MLFKAKCILLILFVNLKTVTDSLSELKTNNDHKILNYNVPEVLFKKLECEFKQFNASACTTYCESGNYYYYSRKYEEFKTKYYIPVKDCLTIAPNNRCEDLQKTINLVWKAKKFTDERIEWEIKEMKCSGHKFNAKSVDELELRKKEYEDMSDIDVGESVIEYKKINLPNISTPMIQTTWPVFFYVAGAAAVLYGCKKAWEYHLQTDENLTECYFNYYHTCPFTNNNCCFCNKGKINYYCYSKKYIVKDTKDLANIFEEIFYILIKTFLDEYTDINTSTFSKKKLYYSYYYLPLLKKFLQ